MTAQWLQKFEIKPGAWVFIPDEETRARGQAIKEGIEKLWKPPSYYAHLASGGHVAALKEHLTSKLFIKADIQNFFGQINLSRVTRNLKNLSGNWLDARNLASASLVRLPGQGNRFVLPFGFIQSPIIASLCLRKCALGHYLAKLSGKGLIVTVYMDDIIISTPDYDTDLASVLDELKAIAERSRFPLNMDKTMGPASEITVFNVILGHQKMELTCARLNEFSTQLAASTSPDEINGILGYVRAINNRQANILTDLVAKKSYHCPQANQAPTTNLGKA